MLLKETYNLYLNQANLIANWQFMSLEELADLYIKAEDNEDNLNKSSIFSALVCRHWYMLLYYWKRRKKGYTTTPEEYETCIEDGILSAFSYRAWLNPENKLFGDPKGAEKAFYKCINSKVKLLYRSNSVYKRTLDVSSNHLVYSLDKIIDDYNDHIDLEEVCFRNNFDFDKLEFSEKYFFNHEALINNCLDNNNTLQALLVYIISSSDITFNPTFANLGRSIYNSDDKFKQEFLKQFPRCSSEQFDSCINRIKKLKPKCRRIAVSSSMKSLQSNRMIKEML